MPNDWNVDPDAPPQSDGEVEGSSNDATEPKAKKPEVFAPPPREPAGEEKSGASDAPDIFNTGPEADWSQDEEWEVENPNVYGGTGASVSDIPGWAIWVGIILFANVLSCAFDWGFIIY